jgi:peptide/nickel transport system ATP-binding protein
VNFSQLDASPLDREPSDPPVLEVLDVDVSFVGRRRTPWSKPTPRPALQGVSLAVRPGETVSLVGESGSGKTTLTRVVLGLQAADAGWVRINGEFVPLDGRSFPSHLRRHVQVVFQDPFASLNPSMTVGQLVGEGLREHRVVPASQHHRAVVELLDSVGLSESFANRYPRELSGGQRQRVSIARALAPQPKLLLLDEPMSSLDATTQAQILALLQQLQRDVGLAYLLVSHDIGLVRRISDRVVVLYQGKVMETGPAQAVWDNPRHPYTQLLEACVPVADPDALSRSQRAARRVRFEANRLDVSVAQHGCAFVSRCPSALAQCSVEEPPSIVSDHGAVARCHALT